MPRVASHPAIRPSPNEFVAVGSGDIWDDHGQGENDADDGGDEFSARGFREKERKHSSSTSRTAESLPDMGRESTKAQGAVVASRTGGAKVRGVSAARRPCGRL